MANSLLRSRYLGREQYSVQVGTYLQVAGLGSVAQSAYTGLGLESCGMISTAAVLLRYCTYTSVERRYYLRFVNSMPAHVQLQ